MCHKSLPLAMLEHERGRNHDCTAAVVGFAMNNSERNRLIWHSGSGPAAGSVDGVRTWLAGLNCNFADANNAEQAVILSTKPRLRAAVAPPIELFHVSSGNTATVHNPKVTTPTSLAVVSITRCGASVVDLRVLDWWHRAGIAEIRKGCRRLSIVLLMAPLLRLSQAHTALVLQHSQCCSRPKHCGRLGVPEGRKSSRHIKKGSKKKERQQFHSNMVSRMTRLARIQRPLVAR